MPNADPSRQALFQLGDLRTHDIAPMLQDGLHAGLDIGLDALVLGLEIDEIHETGLGLAVWCNRYSVQRKNPGSWISGVAKMDGMAPGSPGGSAANLDLKYLSRLDGVVLGAHLVELLELVHAGIVHNGNPEEGLVGLDQVGLG